MALDFCTRRMFSEAVPIYFSPKLPSANSKMLFVGGDAHRKETSFARKAKLLGVLQKFRHSSSEIRDPPTGRRFACAAALSVNNV